MRYLALLSYGLIVDAAVETFAGGSPVRWWVAGGVLLYAVASASTWTRTSWRAKTWASLLALLAILAATAWLPGGLTDGVRLAGLSTARVFALCAAGGIALAGITLVRVPGVPVAARWAIGALSAYGAIAFVQGAVAGAPFPALLAGDSLWRALPFVLQGAVVGGLVVLPLGMVVSAVSAGLRTPIPGSTAARVRTACALALSLAIVVAALPQREVSAGATAAAAVTPAAAPGSIVPASPERLAALENSFRAIEDGLRESPRDRWDPDYIVQQLGTDPKRLASWVRDNTSWIPYRGVLRGPVGVLNDRMGSALDRALLLATLLHKAGHPIRLAHGELSSEQAASLLTELLAARRIRSAGDRLRFDDAGEPDIGSVAGGYQLDRVAIEQVVGAQAEEQERIVGELDSRVADQTERLLALVARPETSDGIQARSHALEVLRDHWWVQRREGDVWQDIDLLTPSAPLTPARDTLDPAAVPADLHHEVAVRVVAERWSRGQFAENIALEGILRPSELIGQPIVLRVWPSDWAADVESGNRPEAVREAALTAREWRVSLFVNRVAVAERMLSAEGRIAAPPAGGPMAGLGAALSRRLEGQAPSSRPPAELTAVWLEYEIRPPSEARRVVRRLVFDAVGPEARKAPSSHPELTDAQKLSRSLSLMMETEILPIACDFAPEFILDLIGRTLIAGRSVIEAAARNTASDDASSWEHLARGVVPVPTPLYAVAAARFDLSRFRESIYVDRPGILTRHMFLQSVSGSLVWRDVTDIVANDIGVDVSAPDPFAVRLEQGVLDTNAEALLKGGPVVQNTGEAFAASDGWFTLTGDEMSRVEQLQLPDGARRRIADDLAAGHIVVAPPGPVSVGATPVTGWWRIDPATGTTLGIGENGWGGAPLGEYAMTFGLVFSSELVVCSAMHEFVAVARDGAAFGQGTWHGLGRCVAVALAAGVLATLFLVVLTVGPRLFFRSWRGAPRLPGVNPYAKTQPDLRRPNVGKPQPDPKRTPPDLGKTQDMGKTQPDMGSTRPDFSRPGPGPSKPGPTAPEPPKPRHRYDPRPADGRPPKGTGPYRGDPENRQWHRDNWDPDPLTAHPATRAMGSPAIYDKADQMAAERYLDARARGLGDQAARQESFDEWWNTVRAERRARGVYQLPGGGWSEWVPEPNLPSSAGLPPASGAGGGASSPMARSTGEAGAPSSSGSSGSGQGKLGAGSAGVTSSFWPFPWQ